MGQFNCNVCKSSVAFLFEALVLNKYRAKYYKCTGCSFIQTETPYWLSEAYKSPIALLDVGLLYRNITLSTEVPPILERITSSLSAYLDYGGGYGIFVRIMRDKGYNFYLFDKYSENLFAKHFELQDYATGERFVALTAFEVFEHLPDPLSEINAMFKYADTIVFSTELQPTAEIASVDDWWYFVPETGQHVAFYHFNTLLELAGMFNCYLYSNKRNIHVLSKNKLSEDPFLEKGPVSLMERIVNRILGRRPKTHPHRQSLLLKDFEHYKKKLAEDNV